MPLTACTTSTQEALTTVGRVKTLLFGSSSGNGSSDDTLIDLLTVAASRAAENFCGRTFLVGDYSETLESFGDKFLVVSQTPLRSVAQILDSTELVQSTEYKIDSAETGFIRRRDGWPWTAAVKQDLVLHPVPRSEEDRFQVDYQAGYEWPSTSTADWHLPMDVDLAVAEIAKSYYMERARNSSIRSMDVGDLSVTYAEMQAGGDRTNLPGRAESLLRPYVRNW